MCLFFCRNQPLTSTLWIQPHHIFQHLPAFQHASVPYPSRTRPRYPYQAAKSTKVSAFVWLITLFSGTCCDQRKKRSTPGCRQVHGLERKDLRRRHPKTSKIWTHRIRTVRTCLPACPHVCVEHTHARWPLFPRQMVVRHPSRASSASSHPSRCLVVLKVENPLAKSLGGFRFQLKLSVSRLENPAGDPFCP